MKKSKIYDTMTREFNEETGYLISDKIREGLKNNNNKNKKYF